MTRIFSFVLVRLFALGWVLALANLLNDLDAYSISVSILLSEILFGYVWGRTEADIQTCKPKHENPRLLFVLMAWVAVVESIISVLIVHAFAPWLIVWRTVTSYLPFVLTEMYVYSRVCNGKMGTKTKGRGRRIRK